MNISDIIAKNLLSGDFFNQASQQLEARQKTSNYLNLFRNMPGLAMMMMLKRGEHPLFALRKIGLLTNPETPQDILLQLAQSYIGNSGAKPEMKQW